MRRDGLTVEPLGIHTQTRRRPTRRTPAPHARAVSSVVEHYNDTVGVTGSSPVPPTTFLHVHSIESGRSEDRSGCSEQRHDHGLQRPQRCGFEGGRALQRHRVLLRPRGRADRCSSQKRSALHVCVRRRTGATPNLFWGALGLGLKVIGWLYTGATPNSFWGAPGLGSKRFGWVYTGDSPNSFLGCSGAGGCKARRRLPALNSGMHRERRC